ncbi:hypothetical protein SOVF_108010, partial [Spinacia oleracea]
MAWAIPLFLITTLICSGPGLILNAAEEEDFDGVSSVCYGNSTKKNNSKNLEFQNNVHLLLSVLGYESSSLHPPLTFLNTSVGRVSDRAYGSYLCRGDLSVRQCHNCLVNLTNFMSALEIDNSECIGFGRFLWCMVRYANTPKFAVYEEGLVFSHNSIGENVSVSDYRQYNETLSNTVQGLIIEAGNGNNWDKTNFATRVVEVTGSREKIYVLVQCTADISPMDCGNCLRELYSRIPDCCNGSQGGLLIHANCLMKYNNQSFFGVANR